jgi:type IV secretion system protein VirB2
MLLYPAYHSCFAERMGPPPDSGRGSNASGQVIPSAVMLLVIAASLLLVWTEPAHAQSFGRINSALQTLVNFLTGPTGRLLAIIGVAGLGIAAWFGRLSYWRAGEIVLGIAIVFGAAEIVDLFAR